MGRKLEKGYFWPKQKKQQHHYRIVHILVSLIIKRWFKLINLLFFFFFAQKGYFASQENKIKITTKFWIFELDVIHNFGLN